MIVSTTVVGLEWKQSGNFVIIFIFIQSKAQAFGLYPATAQQILNWIES